jgi:hypothetical protein
LAMAHQLPPQIKGVYYVSYLDLDDAWSEIQGI